jgi:hypothetical protein
MNYTVTLYNAAGVFAWKGEYETEEEAIVCLDNAEVAAKEMGGKARAEMEPPRSEKTTG